MKTLVVLPTYDEASTIEEVLARTRAALPDADILVVDDGSPDGTAAIATKVGERLGRIDVLRRDRRRGLGDAYRAGFSWGIERGAEILIEMDSDLSHDPAVLPVLVSAIQDHDLVIGSRYVPGGQIPKWRLHRRLLSRGGNLYAARMLGVGVKDMTSGFRAYRAGMVASIDLATISADGYGFQIEMTYRTGQAGGRITEVPISFLDRQVGYSKMSMSIVVEAMILVTKWGVARHLGRVPRRRRLAAR